MIQNLSLPTTLNTPTGAITLRRANANDLDAILDLLYDDPVRQGRGDSFDPADRALYTRALDEITENAHNELVVAVGASGEPLGCVQLTSIPGLSRQAGRRLLVESVHVATQHQSSGIGSAMMKWVVEAAAPAVDAAIVQLTSDKTRQDAHRFYSRLGFVDSHVGFKYKLK